MVFVCTLASTLEQILFIYLFSFSLFIYFFFIILCPLFLYSFIFSIWFGTFFIFLGKKLVPKTANDIKLINAGKILENNKTVGQCRAPFGELPKDFTMHVVVQPPLIKAKTGSLFLFTVLFSFLLTFREGKASTRLTSLGFGKF